MLQKYFCRKSLLWVLLLVGTQTYGKVTNISDNTKFLFKNYVSAPDTSTFLASTTTQKSIFEIDRKRSLEATQIQHTLHETPAMRLNARRDSLVNLGKTFLGLRYRWGGTTPAGFDCSGFAQYLYANFGYKIPRMSGDQVALGVSVEAKHARKGDLAFYGYPTRGGYVYTHTAIIYDNTPSKGVEVIHATLWGIAITPLHFDYYGYCRLIAIKRII